MVLKKLFQAVEEKVFAAEGGLWMEQVLSQIGEGSIEGAKTLPENLVVEMRDFIKRNSLAIVAYKIEGRKPLYCCCPRCLKAHLMRKCRESGFGNYKKAIGKMFDCEIGHGEYYMDGSELSRI